ncbi:hypothetical protein F4819DRAFT_436115 [Hypoxylon fuscum]|nr:hypothetical protein F4819DRAFT_436115 [Hypoxylon fuscum]
MATDRSDYMVRNSARASPSDASPYSAQANSRVLCYIHDKTVPANVALAFAPSSQSETSRRKDHTELIRSFDSLFCRERGASDSKAAAPAGTRSVEIANALKGVGSQFGRPQSATRHGDYRA